jgi:hypothetical protein
MGIVWPPENVFEEIADWHAKNRFLAVTPDVLTQCCEWEMNLIIWDLHYFHILL